MTAIGCEECPATESKVGASRIEAAGSASMRAFDARRTSMAASHDFPGRPSILAISSSRLSMAGSPFPFPDTTLKSGGGESGDLAFTLTGPVASGWACFRPAGGSGRNCGRPGGGAGGGSGRVGRRSAASSRCAISARLLSSAGVGLGGAPPADAAGAGMGWTGRGGGGGGAAAAAGAGRGAAAAARLASGASGCGGGSGEGAAAAERRGSGRTSGASDGR
jgi:hypothetical protein